MAPRKTAVKTAETPATVIEEGAVSVDQAASAPAWLASLRPIQKLSRAPRTSTGRAPKPNEYVDAVRYSAGLVEGYEPGALAFTVDSAESADEARKALRRAANDLGLGLSHEIVKIDADNATQYAEAYPDAVTAVANGAPALWVVEYQARTTKREHKYSTADVRAWFASERGVELPPGKVSQGLRNEYRKAHGYPVNEK